MAFYELLVLTVLVLIIVFLIIALPAAMMFNLRSAEKYRDNLALQLEKLRLSRMLSSLGIDIKQYLFQERLVDIHQHMKRCQSCENTDECDSALSHGETQAENIGYCANNESLAAIAGKDHNRSLENSN